MSFIEALGDALAAFFRGGACFLPRFNPIINIGIPPTAGLGYIAPSECLIPAPPERFPVNGGQCDALYNIFLRTTFPNGSQRVDGPFANIRGPIQSIGCFWDRDFFGNLRVGTEIIAPRSDQGFPPGTIRNGPFSTVVDENRATRTQIESIERADGSPDDCGPGAGVPEPPSPPPTQNIPPITLVVGPNTFVLGPAIATFFAPVFMPNFGGLHIPVNVRFSPSFSFPGGINFPIYLQLPSLTINNRISFFNIDLSGEIQPPGTIPEFPQIPRPPSGGAIETEIRVIGVNVQCSLGEGSRPSVITSQSSSEDLFVPYLGVVRFSPPTWASTALGVDVNIKTRRQFVPCPWWFGAENYDILPNVGVSITGTPVLGRVAKLISPV